MTIRRAEKKDIGALLRLLGQVLALHARLRPDLFVPGTTKYSEDELQTLLTREDAPVFVAADESNRVIAYAFCQVREPTARANTVPRRVFFIDDLCVDEVDRGQGVGKRLMAFLKEEAARRGCYEIALCVWEGNDNARAFYEAVGMRPKETMMEWIL